MNLSKERYQALADAHTKSAEFYAKSVKKHRHAAAKYTRWAKKTKDVAHEPQ